MADGDCEFDREEADARLEFPARRRDVRRGVRVEVDQYEEQSAARDPERRRNGRHGPTKCLRKRGNSCRGRSPVLQFVKKERPEGLRMHCAIKSDLPSDR